MLGWPHIARWSVLRDDATYQGGYSHGVLEMTGDFSIWNMGSHRKEVSRVCHDLS